MSNAVIEDIERKFGSDLDKILHQIGLDRNEVDSILNGSIKSQLELSEEEYKELYDATIEFINEYGEQSAPTDDIFKGSYEHLDYLNGNIGFIDKSRLTSQFKIDNGLMAIPEDMYEIADDGTILYYDLTTDNLTFYQMHILLKRLGIKNNRFHLLLFDKTLIGVDPYDPYITQDMRTRIYAEAKRNIYYYFRALYRYPAKVEGEPDSKFIAHLGNLVYLWLSAQCFNVYIELPRQTGKTFVVFGAQGYDYDIGSSGSTIVSMHYYRPYAIKNKNESVIRPLNSLPKYLRFHAVTKRTLKGSVKLEDNDELNESDSDRLLNHVNGNTHRTVVPGNTEAQAYKAGRGLGAELIGIDEVNFIKEIAIVLTSIIYAFKTASDIARRQGRRYGITLLSTPGDLNTKNGQYMYNIIYNEMAEWHHRLFDKNRADLHKYLLGFKRAFFRIKYEYDDLGFSQDWLEEQIRNNGIGKGFRTDIMLQWQFDSSSNPFDPEAINRLTEITKEVHKDVYLYRDNYPFSYHPQVKGETFETTIRKAKFLSIGIDTATGVNSEHSALYGIDLLTGKPVFTYMNNVLDVPDFSVLIRSFTRKLFDVNPNLKAIICPERDGVGQVLIKLLSKDPLIAGLMAYTVRGTVDEDVKYSEKKTRDNRSAVYGLATKGRRDTMFDNLKNALENYPYMLSSDILATQISTLIFKGNKIRHADGCSDDMVFACMNAIAPIFEDDVREQLYINHMFRINWNLFSKIPLRSFVTRVDEELTENLEGVKVRRVSYFDEHTRTIKVRDEYYRNIDGIDVTLTPEEEEDHIISIQNEMSDHEKVMATANVEMRNPTKRVINSNISSFLNKGSNKLF